MRAARSPDRARSRRVLAASAVVAALLAAAPTAAAGQGDDGDDGPAPRPSQRCELDDARLVEGSGVAEVPGRDDLLLAHDDGPDGAGLVVLARDDCEVVAEQALGVDVAEVVDVEDVDVAAGAPGGPVAVLADTGDNERTRDRAALLLVPLPDGVDRPAGPLDVRRVEVALPDGPADVEALVVDPSARVALLVEKTLAPSARVWAVDLGDGDRVDARQVARADLAGGVLERPVLQVTGADLAPDRSALVLRTYVDVRVWELDLPTAPPGPASAEALVDAVAAALAQGPGRRLAVPPQPQGEAVAWLDDGLLLLSEGRPSALDLVGGPDLVGRAVETPAPDPAGSPGAAAADEPTAPPDPDGAGSDAPVLPGGVVLPVLAVTAVLLVLGALHRRRRRPSRRGSR